MGDLFSTEDRRVNNLESANVTLQLPEPFFLTWLEVCLDNLKNNLLVSNSLLTKGKTVFLAWKPAKSCPNFGLQTTSWQFFTRSFPQCLTTRGQSNPKFVCKQNLKFNFLNARSDLRVSVYLFWPHTHGRYSSLPVCQERSLALSVLVVVQNVCRCVSFGLWVQYRQENLEKNP